MQEMSFGLRDRAEIRHEKHKLQSAMKRERKDREGKTHITRIRPGLDTAHVLDPPGTRGILHLFDAPTCGCTVLRQ